MRSRELVSSSSAARFTAPSAAISRLMRSISPCRPYSRTPPSSIDARQRIEIGLRLRQLLEELRAAELRGLLFELQLGDALAQRLQAVLERHALLVGARNCADRSS